MSENRKLIEEELLDDVVGGLFVFHRKSKVLTYTHADGSVTNHNILDLDKAWERSNMLHATYMDEDAILADLIAKGYIQG